MTRAAALLALGLALALSTPAAAGEPDATAPAYDVSLRGAEGGFRWTGRQQLAITNPGSVALERIWVRLWGNGRRGCERPAVRIGGLAGAARGRTLSRCTAVELRLDVPLTPGTRGAVSFDVDIRVPRRRDRFGRGGRDMALLSNALPALAHLEGGRWRLDRFYGGGEAWTYPAATWRVRLDAPRFVSVAAPGVLQPDGSRLLEHGRDYSWAAGRMQHLGLRVGAVQVGVWADGNTPRKRLLRTARLTRKRLRNLAGFYGPYGWPDLQVVVTPVAAMEHTGLIMTPAVDYIITHELAHQWWFGTVGNDQAEAPWLDEAFATYAEEAVLGQKPYCRRPGRGAPLVTRGVDYWRRNDLNYGTIYFEGACLLDLLAARMGTATFRAALRRYAIAHRYGWSTAERFRAAMDAASPVALEDLWRRYRVLSPAAGP